MMKKFLVVFENTLVVDVYNPDMYDNDTDTISEYVLGAVAKHMAKHPAEFLTVGLLPDSAKDSSLGANFVYDCFTGASFRVHTEEE